MTDKIELITNAIADQKVLIIRYQNDPMTRTIEPHTLGYNRKGNLVLSAYQIDGYSSSGNFIAWKLFTVNEIQNIEQLEQKFDIRFKEGYNPNPSNKMFTRIIKKV